MGLPIGRRIIQYYSNTVIIMEAGKKGDATLHNNNNSPAGTHRFRCNITLHVQQGQTDCFPDITPSLVVFIRNVTTVLRSTTVVVLSREPKLIKPMTETAKIPTKKIFRKNSP